MANTNVKPGRAPRAPKAPKAQSEVVEPKPETVEIKPEEVAAPVAPEVAPEPEVTIPKQPEAPAPEPEPKQEGTKTTVYLVQKGEKYSVYFDTKKLTSSPVGLEKARAIARGYGESNPTIQ